MIRCIEPGGLGVRMLVDDNKDEDWKDVSHARRLEGSADYVFRGLVPIRPYWLAG